jgi:hypothetical protein
VWTLIFNSDLKCIFEPSPGSPSPILLSEGEIRGEETSECLNNGEDEKEERESDRKILWALS